MSIDARRVYVTGFSQGGLMAFRIACDLPRRIAAVATVGAALLDWQRDHCAPSRAVPILMIHGTEDGEFLWDGRRGPIVSSLPVDSMVAHWARTDGCDALPAMEDLADLAADGTTVSRHTYTGCSGGAEVVLYRVEGGGHTWPGSPFDFSPVLGITSRDIVASEVIADFLFRFTL
jgi:polyhydroxybutyrate depolymerase